MGVGGLNDLLSGVLSERDSDLPGRVVALSAGSCGCDCRTRVWGGGAGVSGPTQMGPADHAASAAVLAHDEPLRMAVTHTLTISFLRGCRYERLTDASLLKLGRRPATVDIRMWHGSAERVVAQAPVGYALPLAPPLAERN